VLIGYGGRWYWVARARGCFLSCIALWESPCRLTFQTSLLDTPCNRALLLHLVDAKVEVHWAGWMQRLHHVVVLGWMCCKVYVVGLCMSLSWMDGAVGWLLWCLEQVIAYGCGVLSRWLHMVVVYWAGDCMCWHANDVFIPSVRFCPLNGKIHAPYRGSSGGMMVYSYHRW
jgi:hypothetical protein